MKSETKRNLEKFQYGKFAAGKVCVQQIRFEDMEKEIEFAEEALDYWKNYLELHSTQIEPDKLECSFDRVADLQEYIDMLYQRWAVLEDEEYA